MAIVIQPNEANAVNRRVYFQCGDATDGMTPETGEAGGQPQISSNGGAWTNTGIGVLVAIGSGRYYAVLTQAAVLTPLTVIESHYKSAETCEVVGTTVQVARDNQSQGTGAAAITLTVQKGGVATEGVPVTLQCSGGTNVQTTGVAGTVVFYQDDGSWTYTIEDHAAYTGSTGTVVVAGGVVTSPAGGILTITALSLPTPASADNYVIWATEESLDGASRAVAAEVVVKVVDCADTALYTAADGVARRLKGTTVTTDANGQWSFNIAKRSVEDGTQITLLRTWTTGDGGEVKTFAKMDASKATANDQIAWTAWGPRDTT